VTRLTTEQLAGVWARLVAAETTLPAEASRYGYRHVAGLYVRMRRWKGAKVLGPVVRRANRAALARKRQAMETARVTAYASAVSHTDPSIAATQRIPLGAARVLLLQRIGQHVSVRTARVESRTHLDAFQSVGSVLFPVAAVPDLCAMLRKVARARDPSQGR
jgi:hypothetical protein